MQLHKRVTRDIDRFIQNLAALGLMIIVFVAFIYLLLSWTDVPIVYDEVVTQKCVAVWTPDVVKPCEGNIPQRFETQVVDKGVTFQDIKKKHNL